MSVRWIRNVCIDGQETTIEIQIGYKVIGDKSYTRIGNDIELYFDAKTEERSEIVNKGKDLLKQQLSCKKITYTDGRDYDWK
ncbi:MAG: hypothetical protein LBH98_00170 [Chitinispirillales bacterium]|jgi:hypothetical protein|nr:hypothetical protein [Chitinispirillales bacterium]